MLRALKPGACTTAILTVVATMTFSKLTAAMLASPLLTAQIVFAALCDTVDSGYQCQPKISHHWGQYSPYFSVPSNISADVPAGCNVTFVQILSRHGARDPTASKTMEYNSTIHQLKANVSASSFTGKYAFLANYSYTLGADQLTTFGQQEMINSSIKFFNRYESLTQYQDPFVRSSGEARVVESAENFTQGFHLAKIAAGDPDSTYPYSITIMSEADGSNNTLNHDLCTNFESNDMYYSNIASKAQSTWTKVFVPNITARLNKDLPGAQFNTSTTIDMMDLCPFNTVASPTGAISPFCALFTEAEWHAYGYYESLNKFYGYGPGNPLGPTQGVGFAAELLARLTGNISYVTDLNSYTSINHTLDSSSATFPLGRSLYADFSHDNDITAILSAIGLYNGTVMLPNNTIVEATTAAANGYSAAWTVPFAARVYFEKMTCAADQGGGWQSWNAGQQEQEFLRVIVNDRVVPLVGCGADSLGRCTLDSFVASQTFVKEGGLWSQCFT